jgi:hypothetical protein
MRCVKGRVLRAVLTVRGITVQQLGVMNIGSRAWDVVGWNVYRIRSSLLRGWE